MPCIQKLTTSGQERKNRQWIRRLKLFVGVLCLGGLLTCIVLLGIQSSVDPRLSTPLSTSLTVDIPSDGHRHYICLSHGEWKDCIQLRHHGNVKFDITSEKTTSEKFPLLRKISDVVEIGTFCSIGFLLGMLWSHQLFTMIQPRCRQRRDAFRKTTGNMDLPSNNNPAFEDSDSLPDETTPHEVITSDVEPIAGRKEQNNTTSTETCSDMVDHSGEVKIDSQVDTSFDATPEFGGTVNEHVKEMEAKIKNSNCSLQGPLNPRKYDCFIIYSREDEDFVYNKLIPFFKRHHIKYCEHQEHFDLGRNIFDNVDSCITCSRRVVAVLSNSFFESGYCKADLNAARGYAAHKNVQDFLISIKIANCDIPMDIGNFTYADLSVDVNDERKWLQIKNALTDFHLASVRIEMSYDSGKPESSEPYVIEIGYDQRSLDPIV